MIELFKQDIVTEARQSSKGNQLKWKNQNLWYKADYTGYEGYAEYVVSRLLELSTLDRNLLVKYDTIAIQYKNQEYLGCVSNDILDTEWKMITLERLFHNYYGESLYSTLYKIRDERIRLEYLVDQIINITGLKEFGIYISVLLTIDTMFINEDRHMHNIAVLKNEAGDYRYCPIFDNGACLLSDVRMDYPLNGEVETYISIAKPKTYCDDFDLQLDIVEQLYGQNLKFYFSESDMVRISEHDELYSSEVKKRVHQILLARKRKYKYLFRQ